MKHVRPFFGLSLILCGKMNACVTVKTFLVFPRFPTPPTQHFSTLPHLFSHILTSFPTLLLTSPRPSHTPHTSPPLFPTPSPHLATLPTQHLPSLPLTPAHPPHLFPHFLHTSLHPPYFFPHLPSPAPTAHISPHISLTSPHTLLPPHLYPHLSSPPSTLLHTPQPPLYIFPYTSTHIPHFSLYLPHISTHFPTPLLTSPKQLYTPTLTLSLTCPHTPTHIPTSFPVPLHLNTFPHTSRHHLLICPFAPNCPFSQISICPNTHWSQSAPLLQSAHSSKCPFVPVPTCPTCPQCSLVPYTHLPQMPTCSIAHWLLMFMWAIQ